MSVEETGGVPSLKRYRDLGGFVEECAREEVCSGTGSSASAPPYAKQLPLDATGLAGEIPDLIGSVFVPSTTLLTPYLWVGPKGAVTGTHNDDEDNLLVVVRGEKVVTLAEAGTPAESLYANDKFDSGTVCCDFPLDLPPDEARRRFPRSLRVRRRRAVLKPGDALLFPRYLFHHVTSTAPSVSLNVFASTAAELRQHSLRRGIELALHAAGLFGTESCVCCDQRDLDERVRAARRVLSFAALLVLAGVAAAS